MTDDENELFERLKSELEGEYKNAKVVHTMGIGEAFMDMLPHECEDPTHAKPRLVRTLALVFYTCDGEEVSIIIHPDSELLNNLQDMDVYYSIKNILDN